MQAISVSSMSRRNRKAQRLGLLLISLCLLSAWKNGKDQPTGSFLTNQDAVLALDTFASYKPQTTHKVQLPDDDSVAACLLVMDDNHFLIEWLAYHYWALPLRHLIVAVDPRSVTSPTQILERWRPFGMRISEWNDSDYIVPEEREEAEYWAQRKFGPDIPVALVKHRARQRLFYYHCMKHLKKQGRQWTLLTDSDEFLRVNYKTVHSRLVNSPIDTTTTTRTIPTSREEPGSFLSFLQQELSRPGHNLTSPCVQIPRIRFGTQESVPVGQDETTQFGGFLSNSSGNFLTLKWRKHAHPSNYPVNRISKVLVDLRRVSWEDLAPVESIHLPIKGLCKRRRLHIRTHEQVFVINHYLGTWEQYAYRDDSRVGNERSVEVSFAFCPFFFLRRVAINFWRAIFIVNLQRLYSPFLSYKQQYQKAARINQETDDSIVPWLNSFVKYVGFEAASTLLAGVGELEPKQ
jgi:hypothetical protein